MDAAQNTLVLFGFLFGGGVLINLGLLLFHIGMTYQKLRTLERIVTNGLSTKVEEQGKHMAMIAERCSLRGEQISALFDKLPG